MYDTKPNDYFLLLCFCSLPFPANLLCITIHSLPCLNKQEHPQSCLGGKGQNSVLWIEQWTWLVALYLTTVNN